MKNKLYLLLFGMILLMAVVGMIGAEACTAEIPPVKLGDTIQLTQVCDNCTYTNLTKVVYPNQSFALIGEYPMTQNGINFNYSFNDTNTLGQYYYTTKGDLNGITTSQSVCFKVTYYGNELSTSQSILYIALLSVMILVFIGLFFGIGLLPNSNKKDEQGAIIQVSWLKYLRSGLWFVEYIIFIAVLYLSSNIAFAYLGEQLFAKTLFTIYRICFMAAPIILVVWIVWMFAKIFQDKKLQDVLKRGIYPKERI